MLNRESPSLNINGLTALIENGLFGQGAAAGGGPTGPPAGGSGESAGDQKQQKKKRYHDPNAPKRALTPFFLFMKHSRPKIAEEMGPNAAPGDVNDEGVRRWRSMDQAEKEVGAILSRVPFFFFIIIIFGRATPSDIMLTEYNQLYRDTRMNTRRT